jgi:osmoprotectant transport system permease protein
MTEFLGFLAENWRELLVLTREHIVIVLAATGLAVLIGLPLGILLTRVKSLQTPILGFANVMQTVPSLALFGLLIPLPFIGGIGARTAIIALALYALLPIIRNTVTGILGIDAKISEAAVAMGMTGRRARLFGRRRRDRIRSSRTALRPRAWADRTLVQDRRKPYGRQ